MLYIVRSSFNISAHHTRTTVLRTFHTNDMPLSSQAQKAPHHPASLDDTRDLVPNVAIKAVAFSRLL
jgi:hypothetical protein